MVGIGPLGDGDFRRRGVAAVTDRKLLLGQAKHALQIPPVGELAGEPRRATGIARLGVKLRKRRFDGGDIAAVAVEEKDPREPVVNQRPRPVADRRHEGRGPQRDGAGKIQMMLGHADVEGRRDQQVGAFVRLVRNDLRAQPIGAEKTRRPVLLIGADRHDDRR